MLNFPFSTEYLVFRNGKPVAFDDDIEKNYIGKVYPGERLLLRVRVPENIFGVEVDGNDHVTPKRDLNAIYRGEDDTERIYEKSMFVDMDANGTPCIKYPFNRFQLIERITDPEDPDHFTVWEVSIVSQGGA